MAAIRVFLAAARAHACKAAGLWQTGLVAEECAGLSGRSLRKLPFLAMALFCPEDNPERLVKISEFMKAMSLAAKRQREEREELSRT